MRASYGSAVTALAFSLVLKHCASAVYQSASLPGRFVEPHRVVPEQLLPCLWLQARPQPNFRCPFPCPCRLPSGILKTLLLSVQRDDLDKEHKKSSWLNLP